MVCPCGRIRCRACPYYHDEKTCEEALTKEIIVLSELDVFWTESLGCYALHLLSLLLQLVMLLPLSEKYFQLVQC